ncbi:hypothetical protein AC481_04840 [miscellaneous Crenarchaeota group archaeon SMTZ-80]|nr:MAG: hypothetical protein AC481_04840 [miscellaneous Crenarchaeota group archaeon SMTZ-80]
MEIELSDRVKKILQVFLLLIFPWIFILSGMIFNVESIVGAPWVAWYFLLSITWFGSGLIFFMALN